MCLSLVLAAVMQSQLRKVQWSEMMRIGI